MGMPFASGHYLALRDMVATSVGPAYRAIWHRDPQGRWTIHTTGPAELTCPRYFGSVTATAQAPRSTCPGVTTTPSRWRSVTS